MSGTRTSWGQSRDLARLDGQAASTTEPGTSGGRHDPAGSLQCRLRVMHVVGGQVRSGMESVVLDLAEGLRDAGGEAILVPLAEGSFAEEARNLGYDVRPLGKRRRYDVFSIPRMAELIRETGVDILHSHAVNGAFYACPAGRLARLGEQVCTFHGDTREHLKDVYRFQLARDLAYRYHLRVSRWCRRLITVNERLRDGLIADGVPPERIVCIRNGIDVTHYDRAGRRREKVRTELRISPSTTVVGTIGRLAKVKDLPTFLETARHLLRERPDLCFLIAGEGPERAALERLAARMGIGSAVRFVGWRTDAAEFLSALDVFVLTSLSEGTPLAFLGAMALGVPAASTNLAFLRDLPAYEQMGLVVPCGDPVAMAGAVRSLLDDPHRAGAVARLGRGLVERVYSRKAMVKKTLQVYTSALAAAGRQPVQAARRLP